MYNADFFPRLFHSVTKSTLLPFLTSLRMFCRPRFFSFTETRDGYTIIVEDDLCKGKYIYYVNTNFSCINVLAWLIRKNKVTVQGLCKIVLSVFSILFFITCANAYLKLSKVRVQLT